jgi:DNA invertase Pin-like site-specific DNA recombinase
VREAVLGAAFAELDEHGYAGFSIEAVARRSGVHKTTIYRRWPWRKNPLRDIVSTSNIACLRAVC